MLPAISAASISFFMDGSLLARLFRKEVRLLDMRSGINAQLLGEIMESRITAGYNQDIGGKRPKSLPQNSSHYW